MSRVGRLTMLVCALACALYASLAASAAPGRTVLSYGDSLAVGTDLYLETFLPGWSVRSSTAISTHASEAPRAFRSLGASLPRVLVVSVGTNDDPSAVSAFRGVVEQAVALAGSARCVVWSTIVRPPYNGVSYDGYNRVLRAAARRHANLRLLDWAAMAHAHPEWFGADGVHPTAAGYRARAAATANLIRAGC